MRSDKKILHISTDEKFIDMALRIFDSVFPAENQLVVISNSSELKYVKYSNRIIVTKQKLLKLSKEKEFWRDYDIIIFHSLCTLNLFIPKEVKSIWLGFGFDYYDLIHDKSNFLGSETINIIKSSVSIKERINKALRSILLWNKLKKIRKYKFINEIDYFCPVLMTEYSLIDWGGGKKPILLDWNYGTLEDDWAKIGNENNLTGRNILLGNSANYSCNHVEGLNLLKNINLYDSKIIIPLSYGNKSYASTIKKIANFLYPEQVVILDSYIEFDHYTKIIASCSNIIMPHKRQQGLGNILISLYLGAKIFLDRQNPIYEFLRSHNLIIFTLDDIDENQLSEELSSEDKERNKNYLFNIWSRDVILQKTIKMISDVRS